MLAPPISFRVAASGILAAAAAPVAPRAALFDLDVAVPPGTPCEWSRSLPTRSPAATWAPRTSSKDDAAAPASRPQTGVVAARADEFRAPSVRGIVRVLTWDIEAHLVWIRSPETPPIEGVVTGARDRGSIPPVGESLYWLSLAPWLRLMLHPAQVSRAETLAHLLELGEAALPAVESALNEPALSADAQKARAAMASPSAGAFAPLPGPTPYAQMLNRFVAEELVAAHPYDPSLAFGKRLYALADLAAPIAAAYVDHPHPFLRRNAVFAVGQMRDPGAAAVLVRVATTSPDPVCRARAVAAIPRAAGRVDVAALVDKLATSAEPLDAVPLVQCLGQLADERAVPAILAYARAHETDGDAILAAATALARIPTSDRDGAVLKWIAAIEAKCKQTPTAWRPRDVGARGQADFPDPEWLRADMVRRLARLARTRLQRDPVVAAEVCGWAEAPSSLPAERSHAPPPGTRVPPQALRITSTWLRSIPPYVQLVYLETIRGLGPKGAAILRSLADEATADPTLRAYALEVAAAEDRSALARKIARDPLGAPELRTFALERLDRDDAAEAVAVARAWLDADFTGQRAIADPDARSRALVALRVLGARGKLSAEELIDGLGLLRPSGAVRESEREMLRGKVRELIDAAASASPRLSEKAPALANDLVQLVMLQKLNPMLEPPDAPALLAAVLKQIASVAERRTDKRYLDAITETVLEACLRFRPKAVRLEIRPDVALEETVLEELARVATPAAVDALGALSAREDVPQRASVCLALGATGRRDAARFLLLRLTDADPFVRLCAYVSLKRITKQDFFADWLYGSETERAEARAQWHRWITTGR